MGSVSGPEIPVLAASTPIGASSPFSRPKRPQEVSSPGSTEPARYRKRSRSSVSGLKGQSSLDVWSTATGTLTPREESDCLDGGSGDSDYEESEEEQDSEDEQGEQGERLSNGPLSEYHPTSNHNCRSRRDLLCCSNSWKIKLVKTLISTQLLMVLIVCKLASISGLVDDHRLKRGRSRMGLRVAFV